MWLGSHSNCPICRAPAAVCEGTTSSTADSSGGGELGLISDVDSALEVVIDIPSCEVHETDQPSSSSSLGCSLKRMLSRNRSERKVFPSFNANDQVDA